MEVLFYTIYQKNVGMMPNQSCRGLFLTKSAAESALVQRAEEYVINKIGLDNFIPDQLDNPEILKKIYNGYVMKRFGDEIEIAKRSQTYWSFVEASVCFFGIIAIMKDQNTEYEKTNQPTNTIDHMALYSLIRKPVPVRTDVKIFTSKMKYDKPSGLEQSLMDKFQEELQLAVKNQMRKIQEKEKSNQEP